MTIDAAEIGGMMIPMPDTSLVRKDLEAEQSARRSALRNMRGLVDEMKSDPPPPPKSDPRSEDE